MPLGIMVLIASPLMAIVLGLASLRRIDQSGGQLRGRGLAIGAIAIGALGLLTVPLLMVFLWIGLAPSSSVSIRTGAGGAGGAGGQGGVIVEDAEVDNNDAVQTPAVQPPSSGATGGPGGAAPSKKDTNEF